MCLVAVAQIAVQRMCRSISGFILRFPLVVDSDDGSGEPAVFPGLLVGPAWLLGPRWGIGHIRDRYQHKSLSLLVEAR